MTDITPADEAVTVLLPASLRLIYREERGDLVVSGSTVAEVLSNLEQMNHRFTGRIRDESGAILPSLKIFVAGEDTHDFKGVDTTVVPGGELWICDVATTSSDPEVVVHIPATLRTLTSGQNYVKIAGHTVREVFDNLEGTYPGFREQILDGEGAVRSFIRICLRGEDVRTLDGLDTALVDRAEITIMPAAAG